MQHAAAGKNGTSGRSEAPRAEPERDREAPVVGLVTFLSAEKSNLSPAAVFIRKEIVTFLSASKSNLFPVAFLSERK